MSWNMAHHFIKLLFAFPSWYSEHPKSEFLKHPQYFPIPADLCLYTCDK